LRESSAVRRLPGKFAPARRGGSFNSQLQPLGWQEAPQPLDPWKLLKESSPRSLLPSTPLTPSHPSPPLTPTPSRPHALTPSPQRLTPLRHRGVSEQSERAPVAQGRQPPTV
jgi:hypothetical protein